MKSDRFDKFNQQFIEINGTSRITLVVATANVKNETTVVFEYAMKLVRKWQKPLNVGFFFYIPVLLLKVQCIGRRGNNGIHRILR